MKWWQESPMSKPDTLTIEFTTMGGQRRRLVYESRWPDRGYTRRVEERRGCSWEPLGEETIAELTVDRQSESAQRGHPGP